MEEDISMDEMHTHEYELKNTMELEKGLYKELWECLCGKIEIMYRKD